MDPDLIDTLVTAASGVLITAITVLGPLAFRYLAKKWRVELSREQEAYLLDQARVAVRATEELARDRLAHGGDPLTGEEKHKRATKATRQSSKATLPAILIENGRVERAVRAAVYEERQSSWPDPIDDVPHDDGGE